MKYLSILLLSLTFISCTSTSSDPSVDAVEIRQFIGSELSDVTLSVNVDGQTQTTTQGLTNIPLNDLVNVSVTNQSPNRVAVNIRYLNDGQSVRQVGKHLSEGETLRGY